MRAVFRHRLLRASLHGPLVFPSEARPVSVDGGYRSVEVRHALLPVRSGARVALGLMLHGAAR